MTDQVNNGLFSVFLNDGHFGIITNQNYGFIDALNNGRFVTE